jgi:hypothetical protein
MPLARGNGTKLETIITPNTEAIAGACPNVILIIKLSRTSRFLHSSVPADATPFFRLVRKNRFTGTGKRRRRRRIWDSWSAEQSERKKEPVDCGQLSAKQANWRLSNFRPYFKNWLGWTHDCRLQLRFRKWAWQKLLHSTKIQTDAVQRPRVTLVLAYAAVERGRTQLKHQHQHFCWFLPETNASSVPIIVPWALLQFVLKWSGWPKHGCVPKVIDP